MRLTRIKDLIAAPESAFHIELSNDNSLVNCDYNGTPLSGAIYETSEISIYYGGSDVWSDFNVTLQAVGISATREGRLIRPSAITANTATITVTATHKTRTNVVLQKVYTLGKNRPGTPGATPTTYSLISSLKVVRKNNKGQLLDTQISFTVNKVAGTVLTVLDTANKIQEEGLDIRVGSSWLIDNIDDDEWDEPVTVATQRFWGSNDNAVMVRLEDYNDTNLVHDSEEIGVVRHGDDAVEYYISSTVKSIDADENGNPADETLSITLKQWKKVGKDAAVASNDLTMRIYTVLHGVKTQYGNANWGSQATFTAAAAKGKNSIDAVLLDSSGNEAGRGFSIAVNWQGKTGPQGPQGNPGVNYYTWIRYADSITFDNNGNATGGSGMSDSPMNQDGTFKNYIGFAYNKTSPTESDSYVPYKWTLFKGTDGEDGVPGEKGENGQSLYTWIKYADALGINGIPTSMYDTPTSSTAYIGIAVNKPTQAESNTPSDYTWSKFKGDQGVQGPKGDPGIAYYTWIRYADTISEDGSGNIIGSGMSDSPVDSNGDFKAWIGFAYNKTTATESNSYAAYKWSLFKGTDGEDGIDGEDGQDGRTYYTWIKYADSLGNNGVPTTIYDTPTSSTEYIGIAVNKLTRTESNTPSDYTWSKFKGDQGVQGPKGDPGVTYYTWIRYADVISHDGSGNVIGSGMSDSPIDNNGDFRAYIGFAYNKTTATESNNYGDYKWTKFKGTDGEDGIDGEDGEDGRTYYTWIKYADSLGNNGVPTTIYDTPTSSTEYIGIAVNKLSRTESNTPSDYTWSKFKGDQGVQGPKGDPGVSYYTWIRYADNITDDGSGNIRGSGMSDSPVDNNGDFKAFIGFAYNKTTATESNNYGDYKWTKFKGTDGEDGIDGEDGQDGVTYYTWIKYADSIGSNGFPSSMYDTPTSATVYIGIAVNKLSRTESNTPSDYTWSKFKGDQGVQGPKGDPGIAYYTWIRYADDITLDSYGYAVSGSGMSDSPYKQDGSFKQYIGLAYNKTSATESNSYGDYKWALFRGTDGTDGIDGEDGEDGITYYTWIKYADSVGSNGRPSSMYDTPTSSTEYIGIAVNQLTREEGNDPSAYTWSKFKGDQGVPGPTGPTGPEGPAGQKGDDAKFIFARGTGKNNDAYRVVNICSSEDKVNSLRWKRGLVVVTVDRATLQVNAINGFDTYALVDGSDQGETERASMVSYLQTLDNTVFVVITSKDSCRWDSSLISELQNFGMGDLPYPDNTMTRTPFAMLGYRGLPKGLALMRQYSDAANEPYAEVSAYIINGNFMSSMDGKDGVAGQNGKFYYYAGTFISGTEYTATAHQAPYVAKYDSGNSSYYYYMLVAETNLISGSYIEPGVDSNISRSVWEQMNASFKYLMSEVFFANFAKLGSAVFSGDYMLSQYGDIHDHDGAKVSSQAYQQFDSTDFLSTSKDDEQDSDPTFDSNSYAVVSKGELPWLTLKKGKLYTLSAEWDEDGNLDGDGGSVNIILTTVNSSTPLQAKEELTSSSTSAISITVSESTRYAKKHFVAPDDYNCYVRGRTVGVSEGYELGVLKCRLKRRIFVPRYFVDLLKGYSGMTEISDWARIPGKAIRKTVRLTGSTSKNSPADEDVVTIPASATNMHEDREVWIGNPVEQQGRTVEVYNYGKCGVKIYSVMPPGISSIFMQPYSSVSNGWELAIGRDYVGTYPYSGGTFTGHTLEYAKLWSNGQYWYVLEWRLKEVS